MLSILGMLRPRIEGMCDIMIFWSCWDPELSPTPPRQDILGVLSSGYAEIQYWTFIGTITVYETNMCLGSNPDAYVLTLI